MKHNEPITKFTKLSFSNKVFPLDKIKSLVAKFTDSTQRHLQGIVTDNATHVVGKDKHDCYKTTYNTKFDGFLCEYSYVFCPECKEVMKKKGCLFDNANSSVFIVNF